MVYVISGMNATEEVKQLTCAPESGRRLVRSSAYSPGTGKPGPLIGWPIRTVRPGWGRQDCRRISPACALDTSGRICNMGTECVLCEML